MIDRRHLKLGAKPSPKDTRTLMLTDYLIPAQLPPIPPEQHYSRAVTKSWGMLGNDKYGNCTYAGMAHLIQSDAANNGRQIEFTAKAIIAAYLKSTGGVDSGQSLLAVLKDVRKNGIQGRRIGAFLQVDPRKIAQVKAAIYLFGGLYCGVDLPIASQKQVVWDVPKGGLLGDGARGSWGPHCVPITDYADWGYVCETWGDEVPMTKRYWNAYFFEAWALIAEDWVTGAKPAPNGFNLDALTKALKMVSN